MEILTIFIESLDKLSLYLIVPSALVSLMFSIGLTIVSKNYINVKKEEYDALLNKIKELENK